MGQLIAGLHTGHGEGTGRHGVNRFEGAGLFSFSTVTSFLKTVTARASVLESLNW